MTRMTVWDVIERRSDAWVKQDLFSSVHPRGQPAALMLQAKHTTLCRLTSTNRGFTGTNKATLEMCRLLFEIENQI